MSEKTKKATPHQVKEAREKGQVGQSPDVGKWLALMVVTETTLGMADASVEHLQQLLSLALVATGQPFSLVVGEIVTEAGGLLCGFLLASVGLALLMHLVGSWLQIGFLFAPKALKFDLEKINPVAHAKEMFSPQSGSRLLLSIIKAIAISAILYVIIPPELDTLILLANTDLTTYWHALLLVFRHIMRVILALLLGMAAIDFAVQKFFHAKQLRMSDEDIKNEHKQSEGDPHVKDHRRQMSHQILNQAPSSAPKRVELADMLVVNPTHFAVALFYRPGQTPLPLIHCKGEDEGARDLIAQAQAARVPVIRAVWLARTLYKVDTGEYIPRDTLTAVAQIYQLVKQLDQIDNDIIHVDLLP